MVVVAAGRKLQAVSCSLGRTGRLQGQTGGPACLGQSGQPTRLNLGLGEGETGGARAGQVGVVCVGWGLFVYSCVALAGRAEWFCFQASGHTTCCVAAGVEGVLWFTRASGGGGGGEVGPPNYDDLLRCTRNLNGVGRQRWPAAGLEMRTTTAHDNKWQRLLGCLLPAPLFLAAAVAVARAGRRRRRLGWLSRGLGLAHCGTDWAADYSSHLAAPQLTTGAPQVACSWRATSPAELSLRSG